MNKTCKKKKRKKKGEYINFRNWAASEGVALVLFGSALNFIMWSSFATQNKYRRVVFFSFF